MLYRGFLRIVDRLPLPSPHVQRLIALAVIVSQAGISITGAIVRVTASGLGCPTWPECFPGSFVPVPHAEVAGFHQAIEFTNRMFTFLVVICAALVVLAVTRARRRREVFVFAWLMPAGTVLQAVIGGITVRTGLLWWTVAVHLLASMLMVWLSVLLYTKIVAPDDGVETSTVPTPLRWLSGLAGVVLSFVLVAGTMVTGAGPHAGDQSATYTVPRLNIEIVTLVHAHAELLVGYLALVIGLGFALYAVDASAAVKRRFQVLIVLIVAQAAVGVVQYFTHVPSALVAIHVGGAAACTAATAALWAATRTREPLPETTTAATVPATYPCA
ncbi:heme A synthase [Skermania sp. ID1734]|uniref:COX15/CtaA family protein n=1 Tax=Skermania sp. ID1734 TaxID=2597516 RepID=UPI001180DFA2|nr:heme A synthase [Skermania sp. ID1734]TSD95316.1 heme A synthase [Skermania sp. ID1734]